MNIFKKFFAILLLLVIIGSSNAQYASAGLLDFVLNPLGGLGGSIDSGGGIISGLSEDSINSIIESALKPANIDTAVNGIGTSLGIDMLETRRTLKSTYVMNYKKNPPSVSLSFAPASPVAGEEITAIAQPVNFMNDPKFLYYTWALDRAYCHPGHPDYEKKRSECDADGNGKTSGIDAIEDYKVTAMRIIASGDFDWKSEPYTIDDDDDGHKAVLGGTDQANKNVHCYVRNYATGIDLQLEPFRCVHYFPNAKGKLDNGSSINEKTGDDSFGLKEERFWHTNPHSKSTANNETSDEESVSGRGKNIFKWNYVPGDKIGVLVEGVSTDFAVAGEAPSPIVSPDSQLGGNMYKDSSYKMMWAMLGNRGTDENPARASNPLLAPLSVKGTRSFNKWFGASLIDPAEGTSNEQQDISLSFLPDNPINKTDALIIQSSATNVAMQEFTAYDWKIEKGQTIDGPWTVVPNSITGLKKSSGIGLNSIKMNLNLPDNNSKFYLRATLRTSEDIEGLEKKGLKTLIIPIQSSSDSIKTLSVDRSGNITDRERCSSATERALCPVFKNELIGIEAPSGDKFSWMLDGNPLSDNSNRIVFPILTDSGSMHTVKLDSINSRTGEKLTLTKVFQVVEPTASITSGSSNLKPILLGTFNDTNEDGTITPRQDYSTDSFEALAGQPIILTSSSPFSSNKWFINGTEINGTNATFGASVDSNNNLAFTTVAGNNYSVSNTSVYAPTTAVKAKIHNDWGVPLNSFEEKNVNQTINIAVVDQFSSATTGTVAQTSPAKQKVLASLFSGLPAYINFLFRIIITMALILFSTGIMFSLFPKQNQS